MRDEYNFAAKFLPRPKQYPYQWSMVWRGLVFLLVLVLAPPLTSARTAANGGSGARRAFSRGMKALADARIDVARQAFAQAANLAPDWDLAFLQWGIVEQSIDPENPLAQQTLEKAVALNPENARAHYQLGLLYERLGHTTEAVAQFRAAVARRPSMIEALFHLGSVNNSLGQVAEAIAALRQVLRIDPDHTGALATLADVYEKAGQLDAAEDALLTITQVQPRVAYHLYRLGQFYERVGKDAKARRAFTRAERLDPRRSRKMRRLR